MGERLGRLYAQSFCPVTRVLPTRFTSLFTNAGTRCIIAKLKDDTSSFLKSFEKWRFSSKIAIFMLKKFKFGLVAQLGERTVRIREVRGFDPLQVHHLKEV